MQRRDLLKALPSAVLAWQCNASAVGPQRRLIVVLLRGAVDGLNVVVPYTESAYHASRPAIALARPGQADGVLDLDGRFGLHPALAPLLPNWRAGTLAFVHACGSPDGTRSHFDAQDYMESATPGRKSTPDGWLNRLLGALPGEPAPTRAVSIGPLLPRIYAGRNAVANIAAGAAATKPTLLDRPQVAGAFDQLYAGDDKLAQAYRQSQQARHDVMQASMAPDELAREMQAANNGAPLPNGFPDDAARLARLMRNDARVQMACLALGGWDTHANQGAASGQLANRLAPLGLGLAQLAQGLGPAWNDTVVMVMSEFGRTARQNGNGGTDHGHGNVMWLLGGGVAGGKVYGRWPGLEPSALYEGRDLAVTTDFRAVLAGVMTQHLRLPDAHLAQVLPNFDASALTVMRSFH